MHRSLKVVWIASLLAACGGDGGGERSLTITNPVAQPGTRLVFCAGDDESETLDGVQMTVRVNADGFPDGDVILISFDGAEPDRQLGQQVVGETVTFSQLTLPEGIHSLAAVSFDGDIRSESLQFQVDTSPPEVSFAAPTDGRMLRGPQDDADPTSPTTIEFSVDVFADVEDGTEVRLTLISPTGQESPQTPVAAVSQHAVFPVSFVQPGSWSLVAETETSCGNMGSETITVSVQPSTDPAACDFAIEPEPLDLGGPPVLNAALDPDPGTPLFQATIVASTDTATTVELYVNLISAGTRTFAGGTATFNLGLAEGIQDLRVRCVSTGGLESFSPNVAVLVDTVAPTCAIATPADGSTLTPASDEDPADPDIDFTVAMDVGGPDVDGQDAEFTVGAASFMTSVSGGSASVVASVNAPGSLTITGSAADAAANTCSDTITVDVATSGCGITWTSPTSTVSTDSDPAAPGVQIDAVATLSADCAGRPVTLSNCDTSGPITVTAAGTTATFDDLTFCDTSPCDVVRVCTASVTSGAGITTDVDASVHVDTMPPSVSITVTNPAVACGSTVSPAQDVDAMAPGTQIEVRLFSSAAATRWFEVVDSGGPPADVYAASPFGYATVNLSSGANTITAFATDTTGLTGSSAPCSITLADLALSIDDPLDGAALGPSDGTVAGSNLLIDVCGTVGSPASASVTVLVDGTPAGTDTPDALGNWCVTGVPLTSGAHTITADATAAGGATATTSIMVTVDITPPGAPTGVTATAIRRNAAQVDWTAPSDGGASVDRCEVRGNQGAVTTANWDSLATLADIPGAAPGSPMQAVVQPLELGSWTFGVRCYDDAGNAGALATDGPEILAFSEGDAVTPTAVAGYDLADAWFGYAMTGADLDDDGLTDLVVGAPNAEKLPSEGAGTSGEGLVYVYMGRPTGILPTPDFVIRGNDPGGDGYLGLSLARVDWNDDGVDDVAIGAPLAGTYQGQVRIFLGDAFMWTPAASTTLLDDTDADVVIAAPFAGGGTELQQFFNFAGLGWSLASPDFDDDGQDDLLIGIPGASSLKGGALVLFGGSSAASINPADPGASGTTAYRFTFTSGTATTPQYGSHVANLSTLNLDTRDDVAIAPEANSTPGSDPVASEERFFVFYGRAQPASGVVTINNNAAEEQIIGETEADQEQWFGNDMGSISDQTGDGRRDLVVTAWASGGLRFGRVYVVAGGTGTVGGAQVVTDLRTTAAHAEFTGTAENYGLGVSFANPATGLGGDIDMDGVEDLAISSRYYSDNRPNLFLWHSPLPTGTPAMSSADDWVTGPAVFVNSTTSAWVGDVDGDGLPDLAWADAMHQNSAIVNQTGAIQVLY